jgi:hypothetical protein
MVAILIIDLIIGKSDGPLGEQYAELPFLPGLIVLGSDLAFESIISGGGVTLQIGYVTPIIVVSPLTYRLWSSSCSGQLIRRHAHARSSSVDARFSQPDHTLTSADGDISSTSSAYAGR